MSKRAYAAIALVASALAFTVNAQGRSRAGDIRLGRELAVTTCSECHLVVPRRMTQRPVGAPPDFGDIAKMPGTTGTALFVFLHTPHPTMPSLVLSDRESSDVIAYIRSLRGGSHR